MVARTSIAHLLRACLVASVCTVSLPASAGEAEPLRFGVLPATDAASMQKEYAALVSEIAKATGRQVELVVPEDYADILHKLIEGTVNAGLLSPYIYVSIKADVQKDVVVQVRMTDDHHYRGVCVVKKSSKFKKIQDLAGKRVAYVDNGSTAGHLYARIAMRKAGLDPKKHFGKQFFAGSHDAAVLAMLDGKADVACVSQMTVAGNDKVKTVLTTEDIPDDVIIVRQGVSKEERSKLRNLLVSAEKNPQLAAFMKKRGIAKFVDPDVSVYADLEKELGKR